MEGCVSRGETRSSGIEARIQIKHTTLHIHHRPGPTLDPASLPGTCTGPYPSEATCAAHLLSLSKSLSRPWDLTLRWLPALLSLPTCVSAPALLLPLLSGRLCNISRAVSSQPRPRDPLLLLALRRLPFLSSLLCLYNRATSLSLKPPLITSFEVMKLFGPPGYRPFLTYKAFHVSFGQIWNQSRARQEGQDPYLPSAPEVYPADVESVHVAGDDGEQEQQAVEGGVGAQASQHHHRQRRKEDIDQHDQDAIRQLADCVEHCAGGVCVRMCNGFVRLSQR